MSEFRLRAVAVPVAGAAAVAAFALVAAPPARAAAPASRPAGHARVPHRLPPRTLPLHAGPDEASAVVGRLARGDRFTTHQSDDGWTFIHDRTTRAEGWAHFTHPHHTAQAATHSPGHD